MTGISLLISPILFNLYLYIVEEMKRYILVYCWRQSAVPQPSFPKEGGKPEHRAGPA